ncbi:MAG TPA: zf-HC2 domain-containing protein [Ktedonobacterales bacterium]|jgi:hypothetical protein
MSTDTMLRCALGVGERTLSDFRSDGLGEREMARLRAHVTECPACQARLDTFEAMAQALRAQPEPDDHARLWRNVRASIAAETMPVSARHRRHARSGAHTHSARFWAAFGSVAAVVALSIGFVALFVSRGGWPQFGVRGQATPMVIHSGSLTWRQVIVPKGFPTAEQALDSATNTSALVAPTDGKTAHACQADRKYVSSPTAWATHDTGGNWSVITPSGLPTATGGCRIIVDANNANSLIISFYPVDGFGQIAPPDKWVTYASVDGGATWTKPVGLQGGNVTVMQAFAGGKTYALRGSGENASIRLYVSGDEMRTWRQIDATLPPTDRTGGGIDGNDRIQFWVNGATSKVILETASNQLWSTADDGAHWAEVTLPNATSVDNVVSFVAGGPTTGAYPTICGIFNNPTQLYCTSDVGKTWKELSSPVSDDSGADVNLLGIGPDGSVYIANSVNRSNQTMAIYRLPPVVTKGSDWQHLGAIPENTPDGSFCESVCSAFPSGQEMIFWLHPSSATTDSGTLVQPYYYVATYP